MSAFNVLLGEAFACSETGKVVRPRIQFKFGARRNYTYSIGDHLRWGANDKGEPGHKEVVVRGFAEECTACGQVHSGTFDIIVREDVIEAVTPANDVVYPCLKRQPYFVLHD